ncbi:hypothetical protein SLEP1_g59433 [Rubroshorea leprosula]|uniref:Uncharacterized protein n=1 Tax=Rubroshorea leprosula TaxID=152421 RepID=A0AAV5MWV6_9ROSI|nr:hypothetical protein SLEP1_g59433 [Rubroshorea leprosula]
MVKKMIMVALWCVQMRPTNRPSMHKVVEMLEAELENSQKPPLSSFILIKFKKIILKRQPTSQSSISSSSCNDVEIESLSLLENEH